ASGDLAISNKGAAGCIHVLGGLGAYVRWSSGDYGVLSDCGWGLVKSEAGAPALRRSPQGSSETVDVMVPAGATRRLFRIAGRGGAPGVLLVGPDGRRIEASSPFADASGHVVVQDARQRATYVVVRRPSAGRWRISELPGSAAIARVGSAGPLPDRLVKGSVRPAGAGRILEYELAGPRHLTVTFVERGPNLHRVIGKARGRKGSLRFFPAEVSGRARRVEAVVESQGIPTRTQVVARFRVPPLRPLPAPMISLTRQRSTVVARWLPVNGASRYHALVTPGDGRTRFFELRPSRTSVRLAGVAPRAGATVTVRALSRESRPGRLGKARLAPTASVRVVSATRSAISVRCVAGAAGVCRATATLRGRTIATGSRRLAYGKSGIVRARLTARGKKLLPGKPVAVTLAVEVPGEGTRTLAVKLR
ncbi:MAG: hypothetical protein ACRDQT_06710, partial [Gaiellaceae bacterium]